MTNTEKIDKIYDVVLRIEPMVKAHNKTLYGNGQPGIKERVDVIETVQHECSEHRKEQPANRSNLIAIAALLVSAVALWVLILG